MHNTRRTSLAIPCQTKGRPDSVLIWTAVHDALEFLDLNEDLLVGAAVLADIAARLIKR